MRRLCTLICLFLALCLTAALFLPVFADDETDPAAPEPSETQPPAPTEPPTEPPAPTEPPMEPTDPVTEPADPTDPTDPESSEAPTDPPQPTAPTPTSSGGSWTQPPSNDHAEEGPDEDEVFILVPEKPVVLPADISIEYRDASGRLSYQIPEDWTAQDVINWFVVNYDLDQEHFAVSFYCPATEERAAWNEDTYMLAASTYKLPLNMYYYEMEAAGVYATNMTIGDTTLANAHYQSVVWSMNDISHELIYNLGSFYAYKRLMLTRYGNLEDDLVATGYWADNYYSTHFMLNVLIYLYDHLEDFSELRGYLLQAMQGRYLQKYCGDTKVAHKYGTFEGHENDTAIVFTEEPFLVAVYTRQVRSPVPGEELVARVGCALIAYQTQRTETNRRLAEEEATAEPEETVPETTEPEPVQTEAVPETAPAETAARTADAAPESTGTPWYFYAFPVIIVAGGVGMFLLFRKRK